MHFAIAPEHLDFFHKHHYIEFENLLTETEVEMLSRALSETLKKRLNVSPEKLHLMDLKSLYLSGYDTWRDHKSIQKIALRPEFAEIASNLTKVRPLRIAFDQFFTSSEKSTPLFEKPLSLEQMSCIQGVVCGCILQLSSYPTTVSIEENQTELATIPKKAGSAIFFSSDIPLSFDYLVHTPNMDQLLIVYGEDKSLYTHQESDLHTHSLKKLGYVFGDRLKNTTHPILFRS